MRTLLLLALVLVSATANFDSFRQRYNKVYSTDRETARRRMIYTENLGLIDSVNAQKRGYTLGENEYADLTWEEFKAAKLLNTPQECSATQGNHKMSGVAVKAEPAMDWRDKGVVTPVKNQGSCGSCWTFSTTGCLESMWAIKTRNLTALSEQQLVDCAGAFDNHGCQGGLPSHAFQYIKYAGGIQTETGYPYTGRDGRCKFDKTQVAATVADGVNITEGAEDELFDAVTHQGPIAVAYQVSGDFRFYKDGVYDSTQCKSGPMDVNHAVLAVGYNTDAKTNKPYWIIKNSWGTSFGIQGYFYMIRNKNMCGVATCASYPIV